MAHTKYLPTNTGGMLARLIEEAAEVQKVAAKIQRFGFTKVWDGETNFQALQREMQDFNDAFLRLATHIDASAAVVNQEPLDFMPFGPVDVQPASVTAVLVERQPVHVRASGERTLPEYFPHDVASPTMVAQVTEHRRRNGYCVCINPNDTGEGICDICLMHVGAVP